MFRILILKPSSCFPDSSAQPANADPYTRPAPSTLAGPGRNEAEILICPNPALSLVPANLWRGAMNYYQRHFMQHLRSGNWVKVSALPDSPSTKVKVVKFGWVERQGRGAEACYRITESGLEALRAPIPMKSKSSLYSCHFAGKTLPRLFARFLQLGVQARRP